LHPQDEPLEITVALIKKVGETLRMFGNTKSFTLLEARPHEYVVHLEGEVNNRVITIKDGKPEMF
jgi:hypothetical protein